MNQKTHLLVLGGGSLNLKTIVEAKANQFYVYVADGNINAPCFKIADVSLHVDITDPQKVYEAVKKYPIQGIVSLAEAGVNTCAWLNEKLNLSGIKTDTAMLCTSKVGMRKSWASLPYSVNFRVVSTLLEAEKAIREMHIMPLIIKPDKTFGGSRGVSKITHASELCKAFEYAISSGQNNLVVIEECAEGEEYSCEVLINKGQSTVLCIGQKVKSPLPYRVDCSVNYPAPLDKKNEVLVNDMAQQAISKLGLVNGVAHIEFALTKNGPRLFELGARCGGGHTPIIAKHVSGVNEFIEYAKVVSDISSDIKPFERPKGGIYRFIIFEKGIIENVKIDPAIIANESVYDLVIDSKKGDEVQSLRSTSDRNGACIIFSDSLESANKIADWVCDNIHVTYTDGTCKPAKIFN